MQGNGGVDQWAPTRAPAGRLLRVGVVVDSRFDPDTASAIALRAQSAGLDAIWAADSWPPSGRIDPVDIADRIAPACGALRVGLIVDLTHTHIPGLAQHARLGSEITLAAAGDETEAALDSFLRLSPGARIGVVASGPDSMALAVRRADDAVVVTRPGTSTTRQVHAVRKQASAERRPLPSLGLAAVTSMVLAGEVPAHRSGDDAQLHACLDPAICPNGDPSGMAGALRDLAAAGVTDLRVVLPRLGWEPVIDTLPDAAVLPDG